MFGMPCLSSASRVVPSPLSGSEFPFASYIRQLFVWNEISHCGLTPCRILTDVGFQVEPAEA